MSIWLKKFVVGSPLEGIARKIYRPFQTRKTGLVELKNDIYNQQTFSVMRRCLREDSNCVDVGCAQGDILKEILRIAPVGTHYAFEPIPEFYQTLISNFPTVKVFNMALCDSVGEVSLQHVTSNPGYSGLKPRRYDRPNETVKEMKVKTDLLDNVLPTGWPLSLIKIDVEGAELQVLKGAAPAIRKNKPVITFEHGLGAADCYGTTPERVYQLLY